MVGGLIVGLIRSDLIKTSLRLFEEQHPREKFMHWMKRSGSKA